MSRLAWGTLVFNLFVIVWGALVRATGSGAGCGSHWPLCNGEVIPTAETTATIIEFTHRVTSGMCLILAGAIAWMGARNYPKQSPVRRAGWAVLAFTLTEALIGAGLVLLSYVEHDKSLGRVISICLHLTNTFLLLASLALTAWWSTFSPEYRRAARPAPKLRTVARISIAATTLLAITGAITALGDTLFQATSLAGGIAQDFSPASHFLLKLRVLHPLFAVATGALLFYFADTATDTTAPATRSPLARPRIAKLGLALKGLVATQLVLGFVNLVLLAPVSLQLAHLFIAECLWIVLVLLTNECLGETSTEDLSASPASQGATRAELASQGASC